MNTTKLVTLVLADDYAIVREGIAAFCGSRPDLKILAQSADGEEAVELILALKPDFAVLDLNLPKLSGLEVILRVRQAKSETKLVVLSVSRDESVIRELFRSGANGYVLNNITDNQIIEDGFFFVRCVARLDNEDQRICGAHVKNGKMPRKAR